MKQSQSYDLDEMARAILTDRIRNPLKYYKPNPKQKLFHDLNCHIPVFIAGNGSGKTYGGCADFVAAMKGCHWVKGKYPKPPLDGRICAEKPALTGEGDASNAIIPLLKRLLRYDLADGYPKKGGTSLEVVWKLKNGSSFDILTYDQDDDKFESVSKDVIWFDEPPRKSIFIASTARMRKGTGGILMFTMTPLLQAAWMYDMLVSNRDQDIKMVESTIWDNCSCMTPEKHGDDCRCNGGYVHKLAIERQISQWDESEIDARVYGKFIIMRDIAFSIFTPEVHVVEEITLEEVRRRELQLYSVIDPHSKRPPAWGLYGYDPEDNFYIIDEWPNYFSGAFEGKFYDSIKQHQFDYNDLIKVFHSIEQAYGGNIVDRFIDPRYAKQNNPNTNRTTVEELRRAATNAGVKMHFTIPQVGSDLGEAEIGSGIEIIRQMLSFDKARWEREGRQLTIGNRPRIYVSARCANHIRMFQYLKYETLKGTASELKISSEKLEEKFKDFCDLLRYLVKSVKGYNRRHSQTSEYVYTPDSSITGY
jgi:phage terminase large subunit-like protein